jgi:hypothetical protein
VGLFVLDRGPVARISRRLPGKAFHARGLRREIRGGVSFVAMPVPDERRASVAIYG